LAPVSTYVFDLKASEQQQQVESIPIIDVDESSALVASQINSSIPTLQVSDPIEVENTIPRRSARLKMVNFVYQCMLNRGIMFVVNGVSDIQEENPTLGQALKSKRRRHWICAIFKELLNLEEHKTWRKITKSELEGIIPMHCKFVLRIKRITQARKARLVLLGNRDYTILGNVFAPTANQVSVLMLLAIVVFYRLKVKGYDVYGAFLVPKQKRRVVIQLPKETTPGYFFNDFKSSDPEYHEFAQYLKPASDNNTDEGLRELLRTMYGQCDSPKEFYEHVTELLTSNNYTRSTYDPCIFFRRPNVNAFVMLVVHVDDFLVAASDDYLIDHVETTFRKVYQITVSDNVENYLGMRIEYNPDSSINGEKPKSMGGGMYNDLLQR
jgi:hypothetical protein